MIRKFFCLILLMQVYASDRTDLNVDVLCDRRGMEVRLTFAEDFEGIIFLKGFYGDPLCRYTSSQRNETVLTFNIAASRCGTIIKESNDSWTMTNTLVVQGDHEIQTSMDSEIHLSCELTNKSKRMTSTFKEQDAERSSVDGWLSVELRDDAESSEIRIGDQLKLFVHILDDLKHNSLLVRNCFASRGSSVDNGTYLLLDEFGCSTKLGLLAPFQGFSHDEVFTGKVAVADMVAFRFTDSDNIFLACEVEICTTECRTTSCQQPPVKNIVKRSVEYHMQSVTPVPKINFGLNHLMQITMDAFAAGLGPSEKPSLNMIERRLSPEYEDRNEDDTQYKDHNGDYDTQYKDHNGDDDTQYKGRNEVYDTEYKDIEYADDDIEYDDIDSTESDISTTQLPYPTEASDFMVETEKAGNRKLYVTTTLRVLSPLIKIPVSGSSYCFSGFNVIIVSIVAIGILLCFFSICIFVFRFVKRERKKNLLNRFLLYSYS